MLYSHNQLYVYIRKHSQHNNDERTRFFRKIYLSLYSKGLRKGYVWEVSWRLNKTATYWPPALLAIAALLSHSAGLLNRGSLRAASPLSWSWFSLQHLISNCNNWLQTPKLTRTSSGTRLYNCLTPTYFSERRICTQFNPSTVKVIPWYLRPDASVIYTDAFLIWQLGRVGDQYVTLFLLTINGSKLWITRKSQ